MNAFIPEPCRNADRRESRELAKSANTPEVERKSHSGGTPEKAEWQRREDRTFFAGFDDRYAPDAAGGVDRRIGISGNGDVCRYSHGALNGCGQRRGPTMQSLKPTCIEHHHVGMRLDERRKLLRAVQEDWQIA
jgi:hypothetical protein